VERTDLDARKQRILQAIVEDYVATAEPVGSHILVQRYSLGVKSATIRNEMAEMSERGYLRQPHTSAGRVPSDRGYRFYVNRLMGLPVVQDGEAAQMRQAVADASAELEGILRKTCQLLSALTRLPAVATPPAAIDTELRQLFVSPIGSDKTLLVLLFSNGRTESRIIDGLSMTASDALRLSNGLNDRFAGESLAALRGTPAVPDGEFGIPGELRSLRSAWTRLVIEIGIAARASGNDTDMYVEGTHAALEHPEFREVERMGQFLSMLQERAAVLEMLGRALSAPPGVSAVSWSVASGAPVQVAIGEEMGRPEMADFSVVSSTYYVGTRESGSIGVLGPTRMDYSRAYAAVDLMARTVSDLLTRLSVAP
jgi:heat-inducible transcriptional repressor